MQGAKSVFWPLLLLITIISITIFTLGLWNYNLLVPFQYSGDAIVLLVYIKGLLQDGWPFSITQLSAPYSFPGASFPILTSFDWTWMKIMSIFTDEAGLILNAFWTLTLVLTGLSAYYTIYQLRISEPYAYLGGVIYSFLPYAFLRNVSHLNLVYYLVPFLCLLAIIIYSGSRHIRNAKQATTVCLLACVLQGFNYIYYSYFAVLLFIFAGAVGVRLHGLKSARLAACGILGIVIATSVNMTQYVVSQQRNGPSPEMDYKYVAESEIYGAKLRRLLAPHEDNRIPFLAEWAQSDKDANFPNENENVTSRLGLFGGAGLLLIFWTCVRKQSVRSETDDVLSTISGLGLFTFMVITVGGLGALINVLSLPDIRAYNRFSVFLAFFSVSATLVWWRHLTATGRRLNCTLYAALCLLGCVSLYDQLLDAKYLRASQTQDTVRATHERAVVEKLEAYFSPGDKILQLPFTGFPPLARFHEMESYDHARPYIWSETLRWSWPSFTQQHRDWQDGMAKLEYAELPLYAAAFGFAGIWIDRKAYEDAGDTVIDDVVAGGAIPLDVDSDRFAVLDIRKVPQRHGSSPLQLEQIRKELVDDVSLRWGSGFHEKEFSPDGFEYRWVDSRASLTIQNNLHREVHYCMSLIANSPSSGKVAIRAGDTSYSIELLTSPQGLTIPVHLPPLGKMDVTFTANLARVEAPLDPRRMYFYLTGVSAFNADPSHQCSM